MGDLTNLETLVAPGGPGIEPRWTSAGKSGVGTSLNAGSHVWFTLSHGIVNEVYYPYMDQANIRDMGFIVTGKDGYFSEEKRDCRRKTEWIEKGVPAYRLTNTCIDGRYQITKIIYTDPYRHSLITRVRFTPLVGEMSDYKLFLLLAPHIRNCGYGNDAWVDDMKGYRMLFARRAGTSLAVGCSTPFLNTSCGYAGVSDGWTDIHENGELTAFYTEAPDGNVALTGEIDLLASNGQFSVVVGFGRGRNESSQQARGSLVSDYERNFADYVAQWRDMQGQHEDLGGGDYALSAMYRISNAVLHTHMAKSRMGSLIASLSIPWGFAKGDNDIGGYHLIWPRDQALSSSGFLAGGNVEMARHVLLFLMANQEADGHWVQNMWADGAPYWEAIQMDETALPIILAGQLRNVDGLGHTKVYPTVKKAAGFIARNGPLTQQDRWEENGGYTPFSLATQIAALLVAADFCDDHGESSEAAFLRETADAWNASIERWIYAKDFPLAQALGVDGYYVRVAPAELQDGFSSVGGRVPVRNRPEEDSITAASDMVSVDALALVRFGLRDPHDPRILNTIKVIDHVLKRETATGPVWYRYNGDGYGEKEDGSPFEHTGVGRGWLLLAGERGHYEIAAGNYQRAERLLKTMIRQANEGGFFPEQTWECADNEEHRLYNGMPAGSATPLVWAHSEFIKLVRSLDDKKVFDMPPQAHERYVKNKAKTNRIIWTFNEPFTKMLHERQLRIHLLAPARVQWDQGEVNTKDSGLGVYYVDLPTHKLARGTRISFTFYWEEAASWEGQDFSIDII